MDEDSQRVEFSPNLFVGREAELEQLIQWAIAETVPRRLKTIAAPPGYGKSWLLYQLEERLHGNHRAGCPLFLIRVPAKVVTSREAIAAWLPSVITKAQVDHPYDNIRDHNPVNPPETIIAHLLEDLCENCHPALCPILIVDAFDELPDNERGDLERHLLERFWNNSSVRMIMAFRDEIRLTSPPLRRGEERIPLGVFTPMLGQKQLQRRAEFYQDSLSLQVLLPLIPYYNWTHPKINTSLYETAKQKIQNQQPLEFTLDEKRSCWVALIAEKLPYTPLTLSLIEKDLKAIIGSGNTCTAETFAQAGGYSLSIAFKHLQDLMALSLIFTENQKYKVIDGIREFI